MATLQRFGGESRKLSTELPPSPREELATLRFPTQPARRPSLSCPAWAPRGAHIPGGGAKQNCPPAEPGSAGSSLARGVPSQAGENTQASAPRKQLPPGSLPIFQAYLQATARQRTRLVLSHRKVRKPRGWQMERWPGRSRAGCRDTGLGTEGGSPGSCSCGWHCQVTVPSPAVVSPQGVWASFPDCQQTHPRIRKGFENVKHNRRDNYLMSKSDSEKQPAQSSQDQQVRIYGKGLDRLAGGWGGCAGPSILLSPPGPSVSTAQILPPICA